MLRAPRDEFNSRIWDYWRDSDYATLYRYLFGSDLFNPYPIASDGSIDPGGGGSDDWWPLSPTGVLFGSAQGWPTTAPGFTWNGSTLAIPGDLLVNGGNIGITADADLMQLAANLLTVNGSEIATGYSQIRGTGVPTGAGLEIHYAGGITYVQSYDRAAAFMPLMLRGSTVTLTYGAVAGISLDASGNTTLAGNLLVNGGNIGITADTDLLGLASTIFTVRGHAYPGTTTSFDLGQNTTPLWWRYLWATEVAAGNCNAVIFPVSPGADITTGSDKLGFSHIIPWDATIVYAAAYAQVAPTGAAILFDIHLNGTTIWATQAQRLTIAAGANAGNTKTFGTTALSQGDRLTCDVDQVGSTIAGANVNVLVAFTKKAVI